ncbi:MAG: hypothetical protein HY308_14270 [Gammaproteobacteria bacterium]|nr:hypothetical protein [Gammaproteobacteria bacterium]
MVNALIPYRLDWRPLCHSNPVLFHIPQAGSLSNDIQRMHDEIRRQESNLNAMKQRGNELRSRIEQLQKKLGAIKNSLLATIQRGKSDIFLSGCRMQLDKRKQQMKQQSQGAP